MIALSNSLTNQFVPPAVDSPLVGLSSKQPQRGTLSVVTYKIYNMQGQIFGRLTATEQHNQNWLCRCSCGNSKIVSGRNLRLGKTRSCGCLQKEIAANILRSIGHRNQKDPDRFKKARACYCCETVKEPHEFLSGRNLCKICGRKNNQAWRVSHPKNLYRVNRKKRLKEKGLTEDGFNRMLKSQKGLCAICLNHPPSDTHLFVDHDHETGRVRGLLCQKCNTLLGMASDNSTVLMRAIQYLGKVGQAYV
jgi:Autographiviridae endonuclease VII